MTRNQNSDAAAEANGRLRSPRPKTSLLNTTKALIAECDKLEFQSATFMSALANARQAVEEEEMPW